MRTVRPTSGPGSDGRDRRNAARKTARTHDREILRLGVPALGALVAEPLFLLVDSAVVGHLGTPQLAGLGTAGALLATAVSVCVFLAYGTTAAVARRAGAGDLRAAVAQGVDGLWLATGIGLVLAAALAAAADPLVRALATSPAATPYATTYLRLAAIGLPGMLLVLAATGVLRGLQDTRTPLVVAAVGALANVVLNITLVYAVGLGIAGSAIGTVLAQVGMAAALVVMVLHHARHHGASLRPDLPGIRAAGRAGAALLVRTLSLRAALVLMTYVAADAGTVPLAAHQVAFNAWTLLALVLDSVAIAGQVIVGRALGAGDADGARAATRRMVTWGAVSGAALALGLLALRGGFTPLFTDDPAVRSLLSQVLVVAAVAQPVCGVVFVLDGVLIGAGDGVYLAKAGLVTLACFAPAALLVLALDGGLLWLWAAFDLFLVARLVTLVLRWRGGSWLVTGAASPGRTPS